MNKTNSTKTFVMINSIFIGLQGIIHGMTEVLKGNVPTYGMQLNEMGAITVLQNYLYTGVAAVAISFLIIIAGVFMKNDKLFIPRFILLCILLFLTGGGVAFTVFALLTITAATQMNKPYKWVAKLLSGKTGKDLAKQWKALMIISYSCIIAGVLIWLILLPPGETRAITVTHFICWGFLAAGLLALPPAIVSGVAKDIHAVN